MKKRYILLIILFFILSAIAAAYLRVRESRIKLDEKIEQLRAEGKITGQMEPVRVFDCWGSERRLNEEYEDSYMSADEVFEKYCKEQKLVKYISGINSFPLSWSGTIGNNDKEIFYEYDGLYDSDRDKLRAFYLNNATVLDTAINKYFSLFYTQVDEYIVKGNIISECKDPEPSVFSFLGEDRTCYLAILLALRVTYNVMVKKDSQAALVDIEKLSEIPDRRHYLGSLDNYLNYGKVDKYSLNLLIKQIQKKKEHLSVLYFKSIHNIRERVLKCRETWSGNTDAGLAGVVLDYAEAPWERIYRNMFYWIYLKFFIYNDFYGVLELCDLAEKMPALSSTEVSLELQKLERKGSNLSEFYDLFFGINSYLGKGHFCMYFKILS